MAQNEAADIRDISADVARIRRALKSGDGGDNFDGMDARIRELEKGHAVVVEKLNSLERRMDDRFDDLNRKIEKLPNEWAMARVVFYVVGALMAAAIFGPRLLSMLPPPG